MGPLAQHDGIATDVHVFRTIGFSTFLIQNYLRIVQHGFHKTKHAPQDVGIDAARQAMRWTLDAQVRNILEEKSPSLALLVLIVCPMRSKKTYIINKPQQLQIIGRQA